MKTKTRTTIRYRQKHEEEGVYGTKWQAGTYWDVARGNEETEAGLYILCGHGCGFTIPYDRLQKEEVNTVTTVTETVKIVK